MTAIPAQTAFDLPKQWAALYDLGFSVFPIPTRSKRPTLPWKAYQSVRAPLDTVRQWASAPSNIGIVTGAVSGLIVLDLDSDEAVQEAHRRGIPDTLTVKTAKGLHAYFLHPGGTIGNRAGVLPGWDIRGDGGYVVAPGSVHETGFTYRWENPPGMFDLAPMPDWLAAMLAKPDPAEAQPIRLPVQGAAYGERAIDNELSALRRAGEGERNHALNRAAFSLGQLAAGGIIPEQPTQAHLRATAAAIGLEGSEIDATLASGWAAGSAQPRAPQLRDAAFARGAEAAARYDPATGEIYGAPKDDSPGGMPLPSLDLTDLATRRAEAKRYAIERIAPDGEVTTLNGPGSAGKSLLGQQLATAAAAGIPCLGLSIAAGPAIYLTCEDDAAQLHWRQQHLCAAMGVNMASLAGKLHLISLRGELGNELTTFAGDGRMSLTPAYHRLVTTLQATGAKLVFLDNVAHLFTGNENDRGQVTRFVNVLNRLAGETGAAIILIGHPNKAGDEWSGSTAWNNAVRSRLWLDHDEETDLRTLSLPKANYSKKGNVLAFRWHNWAFARDEDMPDDTRAELAEVSKANAENAAFLRCLAQRTVERRHVSEKIGANYAPKVFATMAEAKGIRKERLISAMDRLFRIGAIKRGLLWRDTAEGKDIFGLRETGNVTGNRPENHSANDRKPAGNDRKTHPLDTTYQSGASLEVAAPDELVSEP